jgi:hypothetical protein
MTIDNAFASAGWMSRGACRHAELRRQAARESTRWPARVLWGDGGHTTGHGIRAPLNL